MRGHERGVAGQAHSARESSARGRWDDQQQLMFRAASEGRFDVLGADGMMALQRRIGNAAVAELVGQQRAGEAKKPQESKPQPTIQTYVPGKTGGGDPTRTSDNGKIHKVGGSDSHKVYATDDLILAANVELAAAGEKGSYVRLGRTGVSLNKKGKVLEQVMPVFQPQGDAFNATLETKNAGKGASDTMELWADCGRSARAVMGSHANAAPHAVYTEGATNKESSASSKPQDYSDQIYLDAMPDFLRAKLAEKYLKKNVHYTGSPRAVKAPATADEARAQYMNMDPAGRKAFDKYASINTAANPTIGGGYTMATEENMPGSDVARDAAGNDIPRWNFHWAGVVLKDGGDNVTLENYAVGVPDAVNPDWNYEMYGTSKRGQSFHEQHLATGTHGTRASTFAVKPKK